MIRTGLIASALGLAVCIGAWLWLGNALPADAAQVPVHWGLNGEADRFATREEALALFALLAGVSVALTMLLALIPAILEEFAQEFRDALASTSEAQLQRLETDWKPTEEFEADRYDATEALSSRDVHRTRLFEPRPRGTA